MSVVGLDIGCDLSKVAVAHKKKISVVPNELTKLLTPSLTAFSDKERFFGDGAATQWNRNFKNTVPQLKRWLGTKYDDPNIQKDSKFWLNCPTAKLTDGRFGIKCSTSQGQLSLAPEQILSGFLHQLKTFTRNFLDGLKVTDCVIACPCFFDDSQRRALLTSAKLAELKVLRLLEEPTAIALNYGILRNLPENETQRVMFVDIGYASTQCSIVDFVKGKLTVRYKSFNTFVGGRDFDRVLYEIFRKRWMTKHKVDVENLPKQKLKLLRACKKIKKQLTGIKDAEWTLDCFHNDDDFHIKISRDEFEAQAVEAGLYKQICEPIIEALEATKDDIENNGDQKDDNNCKIALHSCELVGGAHRVPSIQKAILDCINKNSATTLDNCSFTLNGDESVARGCALMCAMLSPNFRVRDFQVHDIVPWPITIQYPSDKQQNTPINQLIVDRGAPLPCRAKVTFNKTKNFIFQLQHPNQYTTPKSTVTMSYPFQNNLEIGEFSVQLLPLNDKAIQDPKIKIFLDVNKHGVLDWPKATLVEWVKREPKPVKKDDKKDKKDKKDDKKDNTTDNQADNTDKNDKNDPAATPDVNTQKDDDNDTQMKDKSDDQPATTTPDDNTATATDDNKPDDKSATTTDDAVPDADNDMSMTDTTKNDKKKKKKEKKKLTRDLIITGTFFNDLLTSQFNEYYELEAKLLNVDRIVHETYEAKNDLETYIYSLRDKIDTTHKEYLRPSQLTNLKKQLTSLEDWIYDEGDNANKTEFLEKLKTLQDIGNPMEFRKWEDEHRDSRMTQFKKLIFGYQRFKDNKDDKYSHIDNDQRDEIKKYADEGDKWLTNLLIKQDKLKKFDDPVVKVKDIDDKYRDIYNKCQPIINTPKPPPTPPPDDKDDKDDDKKSKKNKKKKKKNKKNKKNKDNNDKKDDNNDNNDNTDNTDNTDASDGKDKDKDKANNDVDNDAVMTDKTDNNDDNNNNNNNTQTSDDNIKDKSNNNDKTDGMDVE